MKSSYSLNSFKLFIVVWGLCLTISKMPVKSFIWSHPLCIHDCSDGGGDDGKRWLSIQSGMILYITCEFFTHHHLSQIYATVATAAAAASAEV